MHDRWTLTTYVLGSCAYPFVTTILPFVLLNTPMTICILPLVQHHMVHMIDWRLYY
jgi:hypothetical protein